jgi:hypothetical protein
MSQKWCKHRFGYFVGYICMEGKGIVGFVLTAVLLLYTSFDIRDGTVLFCPHSTSRWLIMCIYIGTVFVFDVRYIYVITVVLNMRLIREQNATICYFISLLSFGAL